MVAISPLLGMKAEFKGWQVGLLAARTITNTCVRQYIRASHQPPSR